MIKKSLVKLALFITAVLINATPALAATVEISGNGADSSNSANLSLTKTTTISQTNTANVANSVTVKPNTGNNSASENTGGSTGITTGAASANLIANTTVNKSSASLGCCVVSGVNLKIAGNGADSNNQVNLNLADSKNITDLKVMNIKNNFNLDPNTGGNKADKNTGGNTRISTGNANATVTIGNRGNFDQIIIGSVLIPVVVPVTPTVPGVTIPTSPVVNATVLGAKSLPNTGFDLPVKLILLGSLSLIGLGSYLRRQTDSVEELGSSFGKLA